jgi:hypothetical protein
VLDLSHLAGREGKADEPRERIDIWYCNGAIEKILRADYRSRELDRIVDAYKLVFRFRIARKYGDDKSGACVCPA